MMTTTSLRAVCTLAFALSACGPSTTPLPEQTLTVTGSTTVFPIVHGAAPRFTELFPTVKTEVAGTGSSTGIKEAGLGKVQLGMSSREVKASEFELYPELQALGIARDGLAVVTHPSVDLPRLTPEAIARIYTGEVTRWTELGGPDLPVVAVTREMGSGTKDFFHEEVLLGAAEMGVTVVDGSDAMHDLVARTPGAIGYVGFGFITAEVRVIPISVEGVTTVPTPASIKDGTYALSRSLYVLTFGEPTGAVQSFIDFLLSNHGQLIAVKHGFVPIR